MSAWVARLRREWRKKAPLEIVLTILGYGVYALAVGSVLAVTFLVTSLDEKDPGFPASPGFLQGIKGYGIGFFAAASVVCYYLGRWLLDCRNLRARAEVAARYEASRIATDLAQHRDFQTAGTWEWRERVAYDLVPELREYAESEDWEDRRFARQTIKEAWALYLKNKDRL